MQVFDFPKPVSTNALFFNRRGGGRAKTKEYCTWLRAAGWAVKAKQPKPKQLREPCEVHLYVTDKWKGDIDNASKCCLDALQEFGVILNDKLVTRLTVERANVEGVRVIVRPFQAEAA